MANEIHSLKIGSTTYPIQPEYSNIAGKVNRSLNAGTKSYDGSSEVTITASDLGLSSALKYIGTSSTKVSDGGTESPTINGSVYSIPDGTSGQVVFYDGKEFVWNGSQWEFLGDDRNFKVIQSPVSDPVVGSETSTTFIDAISQDANGLITATKKRLPSYLSTSGGTITSGSTDLLTVDSTHSTYSGIRINHKGVDKGWLGYSTNDGVYLWNTAAGKQLGVNNDGTPYYGVPSSKKTLWHTGNFNPADYLPLSGGTISGAFGAFKIKRNEAYASGIEFSNTSGVLGYLGYQDDGTACIWGSNMMGRQTLIHSGGGTIDADFGAFVIKRSNAYASAICFANTTGVLGYIGFNDDYNARLWDRNQNDIGIIIHSGNSTSYNAGGLAHSNGTVGAVVNSSGNVTIGASDLAGTSADLHVEGKMRVTSRLLTGDGEDAGIWRGSHFSSGLAVNDIAIYGENKIVLYGDNVGIGTTNPAYKLDVNGTARINGNTTITGTCSASSGFFETSDERLKDFEDNIDIDLNALKKIPKKYFRWKEDSTDLQIGTSAQAVKEIYPEIVNENEEGILSVDYAKLSVIALAAVDELNNELNTLKDEIKQIKAHLNLI